MIKVINNRSPYSSKNINDYEKTDNPYGNLFHYAHFICDCLFPEIMCDIFNYNEVIREKNIEQTIGNFNKIYEETLNLKNIELLKNDFNNLNIKTIIYKNKENYENRKSFDKFRNYIFKRYNINYIDYNNNYPEVILVKRGKRIELINDTYLKNINKNITTGSERREINEINKIEKYLQEKYKEKFKSLYFERISFKEQINYFNNAKIIICAHGAVMSNMFFCKEGTKIIEITCGKDYLFFNKISKILNLEHIKINENNYENILKYL